MRKLKYVKLFENFFINESDTHSNKYYIVFRGSPNGFGDVHDSNEINQWIEKNFINIETLSKNIKELYNNAGLVIFKWNDVHSGINIDNIKGIDLYTSTYSGKQPEGITGFSVDEFKSKFCK
jgi:hypothetical protein